MSVFQTVLCVCQCEGLRLQLVQLQTRYDSGQRERAGLDQELRCCRAELEKLVGCRVKVRSQNGPISNNDN